VYSRNEHRGGENKIQSLEEATFSQLSIKAFENQVETINFLKPAKGP
jgi:hypothetical protein